MRWTPACSTASIEAGDRERVVSAKQVGETERAIARDPRRLVGIALMCVAPVFFASLDATGKVLAGAGVDPLLTTFMRYAVNVALVTALINPVTRPGVAHSRRLPLQILRSLLLFGSTACNFLALRSLQLAETISIQFAAPLTVALLAGPLLGEWSSRMRLAAVPAGFVGVLVIVRPDALAAKPAILFSLGAMLCYAVYVIVTRKLAAHDSTATTVFYTGLGGLAVMSPLLPWIWTAPASGTVWALLIAVGLFGTIGHWLLVLAHARAPASLLAPFIYTQILWSVLLGYLLFGDVPSAWTMLGAGIIVASGLAVLSEDALMRRHARRRGPPPRA
ncbi:DMT family transporter [Methylorubrum extorquens]|uniref:DMT family transporter n=1 Tax=Methylorubrum extorquens TaxID=408 RepID=UPI0006836815|nr:DMT family transporter [Methylorubrum extorquens]